MRESLHSENIKIREKILKINERCNMTWNDKTVRKNAGSQKAKQQQKPGLKRNIPGDS